MYTNELLIFTSNHAKTNIISDEEYFSAVGATAHDVQAHYVSINDPALLAGGTLPDGHLNRSGHGIVAQYIFEYLVKNVLSDCTLSSGAHNDV